VALTSLLKKCGKKKRKKNEEEQRRKRRIKKKPSHTLYSQFDVHNEDVVFQ
jgi:hypothetical protein